MKILVCISQVPDTTTKITFTNPTTFNTTGVQFIINHSDEVALTRALELKEAAGGTVTVIIAGKADTEANIRKALAIGAYYAIRVNSDASDAYQVACHIADAVKAGNYDILFCGKESIDYNGASVSGMLAACLDIPFVSLVTKLTVAGTQATLEREIDGGKEIVSASLPVVISAQKGLAEPRIPNMRGIMASRTKPLAVVEPTACEPLTSITAFELPAPKAACRMIPAETAGDLIGLLHNEAKII